MANCPHCGTESLEENHSFCFSCGYNLAGETGKLDPDTVLENRYVIVKTLGKGGMGAVYQALDLRLNNIPVAIKEMSTRAVGTGNLQGAIAAFKKEATMLVSLRHPALPRITDFFSRGEDRWYLVMDFIEGETLAQAVKRRGRIPQEKVLDWAIQLCEILEYLHEQKPPVIFRDLKPSNIMVTPKGKIKLIDFGIARHFKAGSSVDTSAYGSAGYAPPEQYGDNQTDARSDLYALGAVLHFLLTGKDPSKNPFTFEPPGEIVPTPVSHALEVAIMKALSLKPGDRPGSAKEMLGLLKEDGSDMAGRTETIPIAGPATEKKPEELSAVKQETEQVLTETLKVQQNTETIGILGLVKPEPTGIVPEDAVGINTPKEFTKRSEKRQQAYSSERNSNIEGYSDKKEGLHQGATRDKTKFVVAVIGLTLFMTAGWFIFSHLGKKEFKNELNQPLLTASMELNEGEIKRLLKNGADPNVRGDGGLTPLLVVLSYDTRLGLVKELLDSGADPNINDPRTGVTPLVYAILTYKVDVARVLIDAGAKVTNEALFASCSIGNYELVRECIKKGADPMVTDNGVTTLMNAASGGNIEVVNLLLNYGVDPKAQDPLGNTALKNGLYSPEVTKILLDAGADPNVLFVGEGNKTLLMHAAEYSRHEVVKYLLDAGADPNAKTGDGKTALWFATKRGRVGAANFLVDAGAEGARIDTSKVSKTMAGYYLRDAAAFNDVGDVVVWLHAGADPSFREGGLPPITRAATLGNKEVVEILIASGSDIKSIDETLSFYGNSIKPEIIEILEKAKSKRS